MVPCQSCGKNFGTKSIKIHEPQCMKRVQVESDKRPAHSKRKESNSEEKTEATVVQENISSPTGVSRVGRQAYILQFA